MDGIQFVIDDNGQKVAVIIDLRKHSDLWEEFYSNLIVHTKEPRATKLGGIWKGMEITNEDIKKNRKELLSKLEEKY